MYTDTQTERHLDVREYSATIINVFIHTSGAHFERKQIYLKFTYHIVSNIYPQTAIFIIESLKSTCICSDDKTHPLYRSTVMMGKLTLGFLYDPFVLVNIISLKTYLN